MASSTPERPQGRPLDAEGPVLTLDSIAPCPDCGRWGPHLIHQTEPSADAVEPDEDHPLVVTLWPAGGDFAERGWKLWCICGYEDEGYGDPPTVRLAYPWAVDLLHAAQAEE